MKIRYTFWCCFVLFVLNAIECSHIKNQTEINELFESDGANDTDHDRLQPKNTLVESSPSDVKKEEGNFQLI